MIPTLLLEDSTYMRIFLSENWMLSSAFSSENYILF